MVISPHRRRVIWSLSAQVFIAGAVVMALELVGSRILAPDFGNSIFVWGSLIGVVLTALSLGYRYGGRLADRILSHRTFSSIIFSAGLVTLFIPYLSPIVIDLALGLGLGNRYGPLLVTTLLLGLPTFLLGMVSPYAIKLATASLSSLGQVAGNLYALSTLGSIAGTFATVFILIPSMDVRTIISGLGIALLAASLISLSWVPRILFVMVVLLVLSPFSGLLLEAYVHSGNVVYEKETLYSHLDVVDSNGIRTLYLNGMPHSAMYLDGSSNLVFTYTKYFALGFGFNKDIDEVLFVGGGGFSGPKKFLQDYPEVKVDVVEIDADVIYVAKRFFNVKDDPRLTVYNEDGRSYLSRTTKTYDLIILDAYSTTYVPFHLMTHEFFETLYGRLNEQGVVVSNLITSLVGDTSNLFWAEYKTVAQIFPSLYVFYTSDYGAGLLQNVILVASKDQQMLSKEALMEQIQKSPPVNPSEMLGLVSRLWNDPIRVENVPILTDNFAPVEMLLNPVTGKPYALESEHQLRRPARVVWSETSTMVVTALGAITVIWLFMVLPSSLHWRPNIRYKLQFGNNNHWATIPIL